MKRAKVLSVDGSDAPRELVGMVGTVVVSSPDGVDLEFEEDGLPRACDGLRVWSFEHDEVEIQAESP
jgi:hypothetical protein